MYEALYYQPTWVLYLRGAPVYLHLYLCLYLVPELGSSSFETQRRGVPDAVVPDVGAEARDR